MRTPDAFTPHQDNDHATELWSPDEHHYTVYPPDDESAEPEQLLGPDGSAILAMVRRHPIGFHEENGRA